MSCSAIRWYDSDCIELYNLREDLSEKHNLSQVYPERVAELERKLSRWQEQTGAKFPTSNPDYQ